MRDRDSRHSEIVASLRLLLFALTLLALVFPACARSPREFTVHPLDDSPAQRAMVDSIAAALAGPMQERAAEDALLLEMAELYAPLTPDQRGFLDAIRGLPGGDAELDAAPDVEWVRLEGQRVGVGSESVPLGLVLLPAEAARAFDAMNAAMEQDLGRGLRIGSGYRTAANQLYVFVTYLPLYDYRVERILPHVSLPGASQHNRIERQGFDFVAASGVDLTYSDPEAFRALEEFRWLRAHAGRFGIVKNDPDDDSPWHWHFEADR